MLSPIAGPERTEVAQVIVMPASKYLHVTMRPRQGKPWQAMVCGEYLGTFATAEEAAQAAADKLGQPKKTLLRSRSSSGIPKPLQHLRSQLSDHTGLSLGTAETLSGK